MCWGPTPKHTSLHLPHSSPHTPTHFLFLYTFPHPFPLTPYTPPPLSLPPSTPQHISLHLPPHPPIPLPTATLTSSYTPTQFPTHPMHSPHIFPHSFDCDVAKLPCDNVTLINSTGLWKSPIKFFMTAGNLKSCFGCRQCKFSMYESVAKLPCSEVTVAKLPCGEVAGNRYMTPCHTNITSYSILLFSQTRLFTPGHTNPN